MESKYLRIDLSLLRVTTVASVACKDISLDRASDVLLWMEEAGRQNNFQLSITFKLDHSFQHFKKIH